MAKGQKRSNREIKKPKKSAAEKAKSGGGSVYSQTWKTPTGSPPTNRANAPRLVGMFGILSVRSDTTG